MAWTGMEQQMAIMYYTMTIKHNNNNSDNNNDNDNDSHTNNDIVYYTMI